MDSVELSTGVTGYLETEVAKSNVIPIRPSKAEASAEARSIPAPGDRFTRSSDGDRVSDGVTDTVTLSSAAQAVPQSSARDARVAGVIKAVQNGTYQVDSEAVANAILSKMAKRTDASGGE